MLTATPHSEDQTDDREAKDSRDVKGSDQNALTRSFERPSDKYYLDKWNSENKAAEDREQERLGKSKEKYDSKMLQRELFGDDDVAIASERRKRNMEERARRRGRSVEEEALTRGTKNLSLREERR